MTQQQGSDTTIDLKGIEVGGDEPMNISGTYGGDGNDVEVDEESFDEGLDMRNLGDEEDNNGSDTGGADDGTADNEDSNGADEGDGTPDAADEVDRDKVEAPEDLGEFRADDAETLQKFTDQYYTDGVMNLPVLYAEFEKNFAAGNASLNAGTEDFLASRGIPKEVLKDHYEAYNIRVNEAKRVNAENDAKLTELAGGRDRYTQALEWARKTGAYNEAAISGFNKIMRGGDYQAKADAVELLMNRFDKSNPAPKRDEPRRDATKGSGKTNNSGVKPFANRAEYAKARKEAGDDLKKLRLVDERARAGGF